MEKQVSHFKIKHNNSTRSCFSYCITGGAISDWNLTVLFEFAYISAPSLVLVQGCSLIALLMSGDPAFPNPVWHWFIHANIALPWEYHGKQETEWSGGVWGWDNRGGNSEQTANNRRIEICNQAMWDILQGVDIVGSSSNLKHNCTEQGDCPSNLSMLCILLISNIRSVSSHKHTL